MPVAASIRDATSPSSCDTAGSGPPPRACPDGGAEILDLEMLVAGYLSAVATALDERGIALMTLHPDGLGRQGRGQVGPGQGVLCGTLSLRPTGTGPGPGWGPTQVDWHQDTGWSARLRRGINGHLIIWRFLQAPTVPRPEVVAGFVAALAAGDDVGMATPARFAGRRQTVIARLGRFAVPEPS